MKCIYLSFYFVYIAEKIAGKNKIEANTFAFAFFSTKKPSEWLKKPLLRLKQYGILRG